MSLIFLPPRGSTLRRLIVEDGGQDLIEYALLAAAIGTAGFAAMGLIGAAINAVYGSWQGSVNSLWEPQPPA